MIKQIWKFKLHPDYFWAEMPEGAKVLTAQVQRDDICVWAEVDPSAPNEMRDFKVYGTGEKMFEDPGTYLGTVQLRGGALVLHIYDPK